VKEALKNAGVQGMTVAEAQASDDSGPHRGLPGCRVRGRLRPQDPGRVLVDDAQVPRWSTPSCHAATARSATEVWSFPSTRGPGPYRGTPGPTPSEDLLSGGVGLTGPTGSSPSARISRWWAVASLAAAMVGVAEERSPVTDRSDPS